MFFHVEERRAWVRTHKRIIVYDRDPGYARFASDPSGTIKLMLRIWLAEPAVGQPHLLAYLGTAMFCFTGPSAREIRRLFRFASRAATAAGQSAGALRHKLGDLLRQYVRNEYGP